MEERTKNLALLQVSTNKTIQEPFRKPLQESAEPASNISHLDTDCGKPWHLTLPIFRLYAPTRGAVQFQCKHSANGAKCN